MFFPSDEEIDGLRLDNQASLPPPPHRSSKSVLNAKMAKANKYKQTDLFVLSAAEANEGESCFLPQTKNTESLEGIEVHDDDDDDDNDDDDDDDDDWLRQQQQ